MAPRTISALEPSKPAEQPASSPKKPDYVPLRPYGWVEWVSVVTLALLGGFLTAGVLIWFGTTGDGGFVGKTTATTIAADKSQTVTTTDYSDTIVIFALTIGATLILAAGLYGRLRDLTLGSLKITLDDAPDDDGDTDGESKQEDPAVTDGVVKDGAVKSGVGK